MTTKNFDFHEINYNIILKYSIAGILLSLGLSIIFYFLFSKTVIMQIEYAYYAFLGLYPYSFCLGLIISVSILTAHIKNLSDSIIVGFIIALFTGLLQNATILMIYGGQELMFFLEFVDNQTIVLIILGLIFSYIGNIALKERINFPIINRYLG